MGKLTVKKVAGDEGAPRTISRDRFIAAIDRACDGVRALHGPEAAALTDRAKTLGRTAEQFDALSWQCEGSCGCPMTQVGYVEIGDAGDKLAREGHDPVETFAKCFDREIGASEPTIYTVTA